MAKKTKSGSKATNSTEAVYRCPPSVTIEEASNGYVVSKHSDMGRVQEVDTDWKQASVLAKKLMGKK